jgi:hypothetical protein
VQIRRALGAGVAPAGLFLQLDLGTTRIAEHGIPFQVLLK